MHILPMSAADIENRLRKIPDLAVDIFCVGIKDTINDMDCIAVSLNQDISDGLELKFRSPVACTDVMRLCVKREGTDEYKMFAFADANGNDVGGVSNLFAANAVVKVILDLDTAIAGVDGAAFVQNADTNAYLERRIATSTTAANEYTDSKLAELVGKTPVVEQIEIIGNKIVGEKTAEGGEIFNAYEDGVAGDYPYQRNQAGFGAHAEGANTKALAIGSHTEGYGSVVEETGLAGHAEGFCTIVVGSTGHAEGDSTIVYGSSGHAEGHRTEAFGKNSHVEGNKTQTGYYWIDNDGNYCTAYGIVSNEAALGDLLTYHIDKKGNNAHAEGDSTKAYGNHSHAEGFETSADKAGAHAEGYRTVAGGANSHTEGEYTKTADSASAAHAEGAGTIAGSAYQHVQGRFNIADNADVYAHIVGNGHKWEGKEEVRSNAHTVDWNGNAWFAGNMKFGGTGYADPNAKEFDLDKLEKVLDEIILNHEEILLFTFTALTQPYYYESGRPADHFQEEQCQAIEDMTWAEWIESKFNKYGFYINSDNQICNGYHRIVVYKSGSNIFKVTAQDKIIKNMNYDLG